MKPKMNNTFTFCTFLKNISAAIFITRCFLTGCFMNMFLVSSLFAADSSPLSDPFFMVGKMFSSLIIVLGAGGLFLFFGKKFLPNKLGLTQDSKLIKIVSKTYIGNRKTLMLVNVLDEMILIGVSNNDISMLTKLKENNAKSKDITDLISSEVTFDKE